MSATMTEDVVETRTSDDPDDSAHIVFVPAHLRGKGVSPQALVLQARVEGTPIRALCGFTWVPSKDPAACPVCAKCLELYRRPGKHQEERLAGLPAP